MKDFLSMYTGSANNTSGLASADTLFNLLFANEESDLTEEDPSITYVDEISRLLGL